MNRIQYYVLISLSSLIVLFLLLQIIIVRMVKYDQATLGQAQQIVQQGQACDQRVRQLAGRIYQVSQQTQDPGLKELLTRQQIAVAPAPEAAADAAAAPTAPAAR